jgi:hypothetical protein
MQAKRSCPRGTHGALVAGGDRAPRPCLASSLEIASAVVSKARASCPRRVGDRRARGSARAAPRGRASGGSRRGSSSGHSDRRVRRARRDGADSPGKGADPLRQSGQLDAKEGVGVLQCVCHRAGDAFVHQGPACIPVEATHSGHEDRERLFVVAGGVPLEGGSCFLEKTPGRPAARGAKARAERECEQSRDGPGPSAGRSHRRSSGRRCAHEAHRGARAVPQRRPRARRC